MTNLLNSFEVLKLQKYDFEISGKKQQGIEV